MPRRKPVGVIRQPSRSGSGGEDGPEFIRCVAGREPQIHKLWSFSEVGITCEVHPFARIDVSDFSGDCFHTANASEIGRRVFIYGQNSINESVERLGILAPSCGTGVVWTEISWLPIRVVETDVATNVGIWQLALDLVLEEEASLGVARSLSVPTTFPVVRKILAQGRAASVTFTCGRDVWSGLKLSCATSTLAVMSRVMGRTTAWMVGLKNNFCVEILLVVSVSEISLFSL